MESVNKIKQPEPNIINNTQAQRKIKRPNVGVVDAPSISKTPLQDTITLEKEQNPKMVYKLSEKNPFKNLSFHAMTSTGIIACSIGALLSLFKKHK